MAKLTTQTRLRKALRKVSAPQTGWLDVFDAIVGRADGTVRTSVPGVIYVRNVLNGQVLAVYNTTGPLRATTQVEVGQRVDMPGFWQVKGVKQVFSSDSGTSAGDEVGFHHAQHEFPHGADVVWMDRKQVLTMTVLVSDGASFIVQVYGGVIRTGDTYVKVASQTFDLSAYVVTAGAVFVNIEADESGVLSAHVGTTFGAPVLASATDIPIPTGGNVLIAAVLMYESQEELTNDQILIPWTIERGGVGAQIFSATAKSSIDNADRFGIYDSISGRLRSVLWSVIKSVLKTYFDTLYSTLLTIKESDASPSVSGVSTIKVSNGLLVDEGSGTISIYHFEPVVNGDTSAPELLFTNDGDIILVAVQ